ncbi:MAG: hypothetical protein ABI426_03195 [Flavobacterium sp.]
MKSKSKVEIIITIAIFILIGISFLIDVDKYIPGLNDFLSFIWIFLLIFDIYKSKKYLKNKPTNEIRIRSNNDAYYYIFLSLVAQFFA